MLLLKRLFPIALVALALVGAPVEHARAQGCGQSNPNCIVPTAPAGTNNNQAASTEFVQQNGGFINLSGDCTATAQGVITCLKSNGVLFGSMAFQSAAAVAITGGTITGLPNPTNPSDAANKQYVDSAASSGLTVLAPSALVTTTVLPNSPTYSNGTAGVGATLTAGSNSTLTVDGTVAPLSTVVLVNNQASAFQNGIYTVTTAGSGSAAWVLTRATYFDTAAQMKQGPYTFVTSGATQANTAWTLAASVTTVGTSAVNFTLFSVTPAGIANGGGTIATRAIAATLNLAAYTVITTQGYATAGDGGGATFQKVSAGTPFRDTYINSAPTLVGGSGYVNGTYLGVPLGGGTGLGCSGKVTVSGNAVTAVSVAVPCVGYKVGDALTALNTFIGGSGSGFTWTVTSVSTPQASFTDAVGTLFQYVTDQAGLANILQFGAKADWNGSDGSATNNSAPIFSAAAWASYPVATSSAQVTGNQVLFPRGAYMTCGAWNSSIYDIPVPQGVRFSGVGVGGSTLVECAADSSADHYIELCDSNALSGQFGCKVENMTINALQVSTSTSDIAVIYSNSGQQFTLGEHLEIDAGLRTCIKYEIGKGGAANDIWSDIDCEQSQSATNPSYFLNASGTQHYILHSTIGCGGTGACTLGIANLNGRLIVDGLDMEAYVDGLLQNVSTSGNVSVYRNVQQNSNSCSAAIQLINGNTPGNILFENINTGCPIVIQNGQPGGLNYTSNIIKPITCVSGACS